jgi:trimeric autotransporter adhesin
LKELLVSMSSTKNKFRLVGAFAALATLALAVSCKGFFTNPTITSITIDPSSPSVSEGSTEQLTAAGTDSEGNSYTLTGGTSCSGTSVCWSSSDTSTATITSGGLLKGISVGSATVTASSGTATATASATVTLGDVTGITVTPGSITVTESSTATTCFTAEATLSSGPEQDLSSTVTWVSNNTSLVTVENGEDPMCVLAGATTGTTTVYATYISGNNTITSNTVTVNVTQ